MELKPIAVEPDYTHLALSGKLDIMGVGSVETKFIGYTAARKVGAVVDLAEVISIGSMGLRMFVMAAKALDREKKKLILLSPQPLVREVVVDSGIDEFVVLETNLDVAIALAKS
jgi:anti-anti-sigma factor